MDWSRSTIASIATNVLSGDNQRNFTAGRHSRGNVFDEERQVPNSSSRVTTRRFSFLCANSRMFRQGKRATTRCAISTWCIGSTVTKLSFETVVGAPDRRNFIFDKSRWEKIRGEKFPSFCFVSFRIWTLTKYRVPPFNRFRSRRKRKSRTAITADSRIIFSRINFNSHFFFWRKLILWSFSLFLHDEVSTSDDF